MMIGLSDDQMINKISILIIRSADNLISGGTT